MNRELTDAYRACRRAIEAASIATRAIDQLLLPEDAVGYPPGKKFADGCSKALAALRENLIHTIAARWHTAHAPNTPWTTDALERAMASILGSNLDFDAAALGQHLWETVLPQADQEALEALVSEARGLMPYRRTKNGELTTKGRTLYLRAYIYDAKYDVVSLYPWSARLIALDRLAQALCAGEDPRTASSAVEGVLTLIQREKIPAFATHELPPGRILRSFRFHKNGSVRVECRSATDAAKIAGVLEEETQ